MALTIPPGGAAAILLAVCASVAEAPEKTERTVLLLRFEGDAAAPVDDSPGKVAIRASGVTSVRGRYGKAAGFDGVGYVELPGSVFPAAGEFTLEAWFRSRTGPMVLWAGYSPGMRVVGLTGGRIRFSLSDGKTHVHEDTFYAFDDNRWHKLAVVVRAARRATLYIDGVLIAGLRVPGRVRYPQRVFLGGWPRYSDTRGEWMTGAIDEVRLSNAARSPAEIFGGRRP